MADEPPQLVHVTQEIAGRSVKITASVTVRKPGPEQYGFQEFAVYYGKEYPDTVNVKTAREEVAKEAVAALIDVGREYKIQYAAAHNPGSDA